MKPEQDASLNLKMPPRAVYPASSGAPFNASNLQNIIIILLVAWLARFVFVLVAPPEARSVDSYSWESVANTLEAGGNPYKNTSMLNWPPFWMQLIYLISKTAAALGVPFVRILQVFLTLVESAVIIVLVKLIRDIKPTARVRSLVIAGLALNPAAILLICQHSNFDVLVALWLMLFMDSLLRYNRFEASTDWLAACLFLGLGVLTKTVPLILVPLLVGGFCQMPLRTKILGLALLLGPCALGLSVVYVLAPVDITTKVLAYRSQSGFFGVSGLLRVVGAESFNGFADALFYLLAAVAAIVLSAWLWRRRHLDSRDTVLSAALLLALIPGIGPGYASQYLYWFLPFLVATFAFYGGGWRWVLAGFAAISAGTYCVEYGLFADHGMLLIHMAMRAHNVHRAMSLAAVGNSWYTRTGQTLVQLPLFAAYLAVLATGSGILLRSLRKQSANCPAKQT